MKFKNYYQTIFESTSQENSLKYLKKFVPNEEIAKKLWDMDQTPSKGDVPNIVRLYQQSNDLNTLNLYLQKYYKFKKTGILRSIDPNFIRFTEKIDALEAKKANSLTKVKVDKTINPEDVLVDNEEIQILKAHNKNACIQYGAGYTFCISRPGGGNLYHGYRSNSHSTFYFIFFKKTPEHDPRHIMVLDRHQYGWMVTYADNDTQSTEWEDIIEEFPILKQYEKLFVNNPLTDEEKIRASKVDLFKQNPSIPSFNKLNYEEKAQALSEVINLPDYIFTLLDSDLRNEFISSGANLTRLQINSLTPKEIERYKKVRNNLVPHIAYSKEYKFNKFDIDIPVIKQKIKNDHETAIKKLENANPEGLDRNSGKYYTLSNLILIQLPNLSHLTERDSLHLENCHLESLEGCPKKLWDFYCVNNNLENLEGGPEETFASYTCSKNGLTSLKGGPKKVGTQFYCRENKLTNLEGGPKEIGVMYDCSSNELTSLKGAPEVVTIFNCSFNKLTSLKDGPKIVQKSMDIAGNPSLTDVENVPLFLTKDIDVKKRIRRFSDWLYGNDKRLYGIQSSIPSTKLEIEFIDNLNKKLEEYIKDKPEYEIVDESVFPRFNGLVSKNLNRIKY